MKIIELCVYALIILAAVVWILTRGGLYRPSPDTPPPSFTQSKTPETEASPPLSINVPRGEVFPTAELDGGIFMPETGGD
jgi:hypothetical protein